ncbi:unnamed protein product, partial [Ectocarpus sp. 12 AP-2014]
RTKKQPDLTYSAAEARDDGNVEWSKPQKQFIAAIRREARNREQIQAHPPRGQDLQLRHPFCPRQHCTRCLRRRRHLEQPPRGLDRQGGPDAQVRLLAAPPVLVRAVMPVLLSAGGRWSPRAGRRAAGRLRGRRGTKRRTIATTAMTVATARGR